MVSCSELQCGFAVAPVLEGVLRAPLVASCAPGGVVRCSVLHCVAVGCSELRCVAVRCSALQ